MEQEDSMKGYKRGKERVIRDLQIDDYNNDYYNDEYKDDLDDSNNLPSDGMLDHVEVIRENFKLFDPIIQSPTNFGGA